MSLEVVAEHTRSGSEDNLVSEYRVIFGVPKSTAVVCDFDLEQYLHIGELGRVEKATWISIDVLIGWRVA